MFGRSLVMVLGLLALPAAAYAQDMGGDCGEGSDYGALVRGGESGAAGYSATNPGSTATGAYQFTYGTLVDLGYINGSASKHPGPGAGDWSGVVWTAESGVSSRAEFMANQGSQDRAIGKFTSKQLGAISNSYTPGQMVNGVAMSNGGAAYAAHMLGSGGFNKWAASGFSASGLDPKIAAAHGWTPEQYNAHLMKRVAEGGCFDPGDIAMGNDEIDDLPEIFLMPWKPMQRAPVIMPGQLRSLSG